MREPLFALWCPYDDRFTSHITYPPPRFKNLFTSLQNQNTTQYGRKPVTFFHRIALFKRAVRFSDGAATAEAGSDDDFDFDLTKTGDAEFEVQDITRWVPGLKSA